MEELKISSSPSKSGDKNVLDKLLRKKSLSWEGSDTSSLSKFDYVELRVSKSSFKGETSTAKPTSAIILELQRVFNLMAIEYTNFNVDKGLKCNCTDKLKNVKFEVEVCKIDKLEGLKGVKLKKKSGNSYDWSALEENLLSLLKL